MSLSERDARYARLVMAACSYCADGVPHHTNAGGSIGGADRHPVLDLHQVEDATTMGGLVECLAGDIWQEWLRGV